MQTSCDKHLCSNTVALAHQTQQDMLGADGVVPRCSASRCESSSTFFARGVNANVADRRPAATLGDDLVDLGPHILQFDAERCERSCPYTVALVQQPEEQMLSPDVAVAQQSRFFRREHHDPTGTISESFKHSRSR
jgi:hypothetical protein